jgi:hypothetical protein
MSEESLQYPRVRLPDGDDFEAGQHLTAAHLATPAPTHVKAADVLIVCGQGVYHQGTYFGEYHDRDVYFDHALQVPDIVGRFHYNVVVFSGGFTQEKARNVSEAQSFENMLRDAGKFGRLAAVPLVLDECALDSAENLLLGLMTARLALPNDVPIRRVGLSIAWKFKKWRFNRNAQALDIVQQVYVHGFATSADTNIQVPSDDERKRASDEYKADTQESRLLQTPEKERKRQDRWQNNRVDKDRQLDPQDSWVQGRVEDFRRGASWRGGPPQMYFKDQLCSSYQNRLAPFMQRFTGTWNVIDAIAHGDVDDKKLGQLGVVFRTEVMAPGSTPPTSVPR